MSNQNTSIKCPNCSTEIDVQDMLSQQLEEEIKQKYANKYSDELKAVSTREEELKERQKQFEEARKRENEVFKERLEKKLTEERSALRDILRKQLVEENEASTKEMQKELREKSEQLKELNKTKVEIERLKREKEELADQAKLDAQKELKEILELEKKKLEESASDKVSLQMKELEKQLADQKKLTEEMRRKQEQGSMQMQGEVQELVIESWLEEQFPLDTIESIKTGARGGDCLQFVNTREVQNCGTIYYESKRTKDFQPRWIEKFKADIRDKGADIGVLITEAMPSDMNRMGMRDGVWVCSFQEFKGLSAVLRQHIIQLNRTLASQENKGDKMHILYDYLTSTTFSMQIEAIVEGFSQMQQDLDQEKRSMNRIWKQREKQIEKVLLNTSDMYGSIRGIAGNAIQPVQSLELGGGEETSEDEA